MTASLPMYDSASTRAANDRLWQEIQSRIGAGPVALDRQTDPHVTWRDPELVLSQTCGLPFRSQLHGHVQLVGTPDFGLRGCPPGYYRSALVVRGEDPRRALTDFKNATLARNDVRSQSGWAAFAEHMATAPGLSGFGGTIVETGSHRASADAVAAGKACIASLDAVTWLLLKRETDLADALRVIAWTRRTPGLPYITSLSQDADRLFAALSAALVSLSPEDKSSLCIKGVVKIPARDYLAVPTPERTKSA